MMICITQAAVFLLALGWVAAAAAAPPDLKYLFPAGATRGTTVEVVAGGSAGDGPAQVWVDRPGIQVMPVAEKKNAFSVTVAPDALPGAHLVRVYNADGATAPLPFLVDTLPNVNELEPNDTTAKAQPITTPGCTINGRLEKRGDVDLFAVSLKQNQTLLAAVTANGTLGSPMDSVLQIVSPRGSVLDQNDDERGLDSLLAFKAPADGTFIVRIFAFPAAADASISFAGGETFIYRLTLTTDGFLDGSLPLAVSRDVATSVDACGWNLAEPDTKRVIEPQSDAAAVDFFSPQWAGVLVLPVVSHPSRVETEPNDIANPQPVKTPVTLSGRIGEPRDRDAFRFHLAKGQACQCNLSSRALGYPLDSVLELFDAAGQSLARSDDTNNDPDSELKYTAPADGDYMIVVADLYDHGGPRFLYRLTIVSPEPDFSLTAPQHAYVLSAGKPLDIPVTIERKHGFAGEIEVRVAGLPEGVVAQTAKSVAGNDSAKTVKIVFTAMPAAYSGPIQILGISSDPAGRSHRAEVAVGGGARTSDLWLTVTK